MQTQAHDGEIATTNAMDGGQIAGILRAEGPTVNCVLLRAIPDEDGDDCKPSASSSSSIGSFKAKECSKDEDKSCSVNVGNGEEEKKEPSTDDSPKQRIVLDHLISQILVDTTPRKSMVAQILGGPFTFLGQYEDEGIVVMVRRDSQLDEYNGDITDSNDGEIRNKLGLHLNPHELQPPLHRCKVYGDILMMRVASVEDENDADSSTDATTATAKIEGANDTATEKTESPAIEASAIEGQDIDIMSSITNFSSNQDFFLDYTKEEYIKFASRTDIPIPDDDGEEDIPPVDENDSDEDDDQNNDDGDEDYNEDDMDSEDEEACQIGMLNMLLGQILRKFREDNGRGPNTKELLSIRAALAEKLGIDSSLIPPVEDSDDDDDDGDEEENGVTVSNGGEMEAANSDNDESASGDTTNAASAKKRPLEENEQDPESSRVKRVKFSAKDDVKLIPLNLENRIETSDEDAEDDDEDDEDYEVDANAPMEMQPN